MSKFLESLNFSASKDNSSAIEIRKWHDVDYYETLCMYCADNDIDLSRVSDEEFFAAAETMSQHEQIDKSKAAYFFWIS